MASCPSGTYLDRTTNECLACTPECTQCTGPAITQCLACNSTLNYIFKSPSTCACPDRHYSSETKGCQGKILRLYLECNSRCLSCHGGGVNQCSACLSNYWMKGGECYRCEDTQGLLTESTGVCKETCGDGLDLGLNECEDGNREDGDGCNSNC